MIKVSINKKDTSFYTIALAGTPFAPPAVVFAGVGDKSARYYTYLEREFHKNIEFGLFFTQLIKMAEDTGGVNVRVPESMRWCAETFRKFLQDFEAAGKLLLGYVETHKLPVRAPHLEEMGVEDVRDK